LLGKQALYS